MIMELSRRYFVEERISGMLPKPVMMFVYSMMAVTGLLAAYSLLTYGRSDSLLRMVFADPKKDWYVAVISSLLFFIFGFIPFQANQDQGFRKLVELNAEQIRLHRSRGKSDEDIAVSILEAMSVRSGYKRDMAKKKLVYYLSQFR
jgi:hypothetical protein